MCFLLKFIKNGNSRSRDVQLCCQLPFRVTVSCGYTFPLVIYAQETLVRVHEQGCPRILIKGSFVTAPKGPDDMSQ